MNVYRCIDYKKEEEGERREEGWETSKSDVGRGREEGKDGPLPFPYSEGKL